MRFCNKSKDRSMSKEFVCADLHFGHKNIIAYENRPFATVEEMDEKLIENWNAVVSPQDIVYVLGDVGFAGKKRLYSLVSRLNGRKVLVLGNHDRCHSPSWWEKEIGFNVAEAGPIVALYSGKLIFMSHEPPEDMSDTGLFYMYGHVHGNPDYPDHTDNTACVSIERLHYVPALIDDVLSGKAYEHKQAV